MDSALGWIGQIAGWFGDLIPTWQLVRATEGAIKFLPGGRTEVLGPGVHWYWPAVTEMDVYPVVRQVLDTQAQTLMTMDHVPVYVAGLIVYTIDDLHKFAVENYNAQSNLDDLVQTAIREAVVNKNFESLQRARVDVDNKLTSDAQEILTGFGIEVEAVRLTDFSKAQVVNLVGGGIVNLNLNE